MNLSVNIENLSSGVIFNMKTPAYLISVEELLFVQIKMFINFFERGENMDGDRRFSLAKFQYR